MPFLLEAPSELAEVVNLSVVRQPHLPVESHHRLAAGRGRVEDGQSAVPKSHNRVRLGRHARPVLDDEARPSSRPGDRAPGVFSGWSPLVDAAIPHIVETTSVLESFFSQCGDLIAKKTHEKREKTGNNDGGGEDREPFLVPQRDPHAVDDDGHDLDEAQQREKANASNNTCDEKGEGSRPVSGWGRTVDEPERGEVSMSS